MKKILMVISIVLFVPFLAQAGGWDANKGTDKITLQGELICLGCSLKRLSGANAQCGLYTHHDVGFKLADGTFWSLVNNAKAHDVIRAHGLVIGKKATISGWIYPNANHIEVDSIIVDGISGTEIAEAAWKEDQSVAKALLSRKVGEAPVYNESGHKKSGHSH